MGEFFHGWRRKVGVVTPLMAFGLVGCANVTHFLSFGFAFIGEHRLYGLVFKSYGLEWEFDEVSEESGRSMESYAGTKGWLPMFNFGPPFRPEERFREHVEPKWHWQRFGFHYGQGKIPILPLPETVLVIPYWSMILPLALASLWLLFPKRHSPTPKKLAEPISETVT